MAKKIFLCCSLVILMMLMCTIGFTATFTINDLAGTWYAHKVVSGDAPVDDPRWEYGTVIVNSAGNFSATFNTPTATNELSSGTIQIDGNGIVRVDNNPLTHGVMNDSKDQMVVTDGTSGNGGNALMILVKRSHSKSGSMPGILLLLLDE